MTHHDTGSGNIPAHIFREYDIRGVVDQDLNEDTYYKLGRAYGTLLYDQQGTKPVHGDRLKVVCGYDARLSGPRFQKACIEGLLASGVDVVNIGMVPTPVMYFAVKYLDVDGGCSVTASHNPAEYNGFKCRKLIGSGLNAPLTSEDIQELYRLSTSGEFHDGKGEYSDHPVTDDYIRLYSGQRQSEAAAEGSDRPRQRRDRPDGHEDLQGAGVRRHRHLS